MVETVSIIVPTFNEDAHLAGAIRSARTDDAVEVIVADGGSIDDTPAVAADLADRVVRTGRNRAAQLNAGAAAAAGSILVFLHADSSLPPGSAAAIRAALERPGTAGGAFRVQIGTGPGLRLISWGTNLRSRLFDLPYGDQAIFVRASLFRELGGFRSLEFMEDVDFVRRLRRIGRLAWIDLPVRTSARRWEAHGIVRTTLANASALTMFALGVPPWRIRRYYDKLLSNGTR